MPLTPEEVLGLRARLSSKPNYAVPEASFGEFIAPIVAPLTLAERAGGLVYNNLGLPLMGGAMRAVGIDADSVAGQAQLDRETSVNPDVTSMRGWIGLLGVGREGDTGYTNVETGAPVRGANTLEAIMNAQGGDVEGFYRDYGVPGQVAMTVGSMGLDPLNATAIGGGVKAAWQASKIRAGLRGIKGVDAAADAQRAEYLAEQLGNLSPQGQSGLERFGRALIGEEQASDFFQQGRVFNRTPEFNMAGEVGPETLRSRMGLNLMDRLAERMYPDASADFLQRAADADAERIAGIRYDRWRDVHRPVPDRLQQIPEWGGMAIENVDPRMMRVINDTMQNMDMPSQAVVPPSRQLPFENSAAADLSARMQRMMSPEERMAWEIPEYVPDTSMAAREDLAARMRRFQQPEPERTPWEAPIEQTPAPVQEAVSAPALDLAARMRRAMTPANVEVAPVRPTARTPWDAAEDVPEPVRAEVTMPVAEAPKIAETPTQKLAQPKTAEQLAKEAELEARAKAVNPEAKAKRDPYADIDEASIKKASDVLMSERGQKNLNALARQYGLEPDEMMSELIMPLAKRAATFDPKLGKDEATYLANQMSYAAKDVRRKQDVIAAREASYNKEVGEGDDAMQIVDTIADPTAATPAQQALRGETESAFMKLVRSSKQPERAESIVAALTDQMDTKGRMNVAALSETTGYTPSTIQRVLDDLHARAMDAGIEPDVKFKTVRKAFVRGVAKDDLLKAPGVKGVEELGDNDFRVTFKNGKTIDVRTNANIELRAAPDLVAGRTITVADPKTGQQINVDYTRFADQSTINHEHVHVARSMGLFTDSEWSKLVSTYAKNITDEVRMEEAVASGLEKIGGTLAQRIKEFLGKLYEAITGDTSAWSTQGRWRKGEVFRREKVGAARTDGVRYQTQAPDWRTTGDAIQNIAKKMETAGDARDMEPAGVLASAKRLFTKEGLKAIEDKLAPQLWDAAHMLMTRGFRPLEDILSPAQKITGKADITGQGKGGAGLAEMLFRTKEGKAGRLQAVMKGETPLSVYIGNEKKVYYQGNAVENILGPAKQFLGKGASEADFQAIIQMADVAGVSQRIRQERDLMQAAIARIGEGKGTDADFTRLAKMGYEKPSVLREGLQADLAGTMQQLRTDAAKWEKTMMLRSGTDYEDALSAIEEFKAKGMLTENTDSPGVLDKVLEAERKLSKAKLEYARDKGIISQEMADAYAKTGDYYTPLERVFDDLEKMSGGKGSATGQFTNQALGSERLIKSPISSVFESLNKLVRLADENEVWRTLTDDIDDAKKLVAAQKEDAKHLIGAEKGVPENKVLPDGAIAENESYIAETEKYIQQVSGDERMAKDVIPVIRDGKTTYWRFVDPEARKTYAAMQMHAPSGWLEKAARWPSQVLRKWLAASPRFAAFNTTRDTFMRPIISEHEGSKMSDVLMQWTDKAKYEEMDEAFMRSGGSQQAMLNDLEDAYKDDMSGFIRKAVGTKGTMVGLPQDLIKYMKGGFDKVTALTGKGEKLNRLAEYKDAYEYAMKNIPNITQQEAETYAAFHSRNLLDFAQAGTFIRAINKYVPFTNAAIQGSRVMFRAAKNHPKQFAKQFAKLIVAPSIATYGIAQAAGREEEYRALPAYRRDFFWNIPIPGTKLWFAIPKPFELGVLGTTFERTVDYAWKGNFDEAFAGHGGSLAKGMIPVDEAAFLGAFRPVVEVLANRNLFYDQPIIPYWEEGLDVRLRKGAQGGSRIGKTMQDLFKVDSRNVDHLIGAFFGDYGRLATNVGKIGQDVENPMTFGKSIMKASGFVRETSPWEIQPAKEAMRTQQRLGVQATKPSKAFRDILKEAQAGTRTMKEAIEASRAEKNRLSQITIEQRIKEMFEKSKKKK